MLFIGFVLITLIWEFGTALLSYATLRFSGRKVSLLTGSQGEPAFADADPLAG